MRRAAGVPACRLGLGASASVIVVAVAIALSSYGSASASPSPPAVAPSEVVAPKTVPVAVVPAPAPAPAAAPTSVFARYDSAAERCPGLDPLLLVAIHDVETGRAASGARSSAGAVGPMQFLPTTWAEYGVDANRDGAVDAWNLDDALAGAARLLCADGITVEGMERSALWNYNHSWGYVDAVMVRQDMLHAALGDTPS